MTHVQRVNDSSKYLSVATANIEHDWVVSTSHQPTHLDVWQPISPPTNISISQPTNTRIINQSINQWVTKSINKSTNQSISLWNSWSVHPLVYSSINCLTMLQAISNPYSQQHVCVCASAEDADGMCQSYPPRQTASTSISSGNDGALKSIDKFCYLASFLPNTVLADGDIRCRLAEAGSAFIWQNPATIVGSTWRVTENKGCCLSRRGADDDIAVWQRDLDAPPAINPQIGPVPSPLSAQDSSCQIIIIIISGKCH